MTVVLTTQGRRVGTSTGGPTARGVHRPGEARVIGVSWRRTSPPVRTDPPSPNASVIDLAHALHLAVVAEGVETRQQLAQVVDLGGDLAQGYLLSRPLFAADLEAQVLDLAAARTTIRFPTRVTADLRT